jgi:hypothetical protein
MRRRALREDRIHGDRVLEAADDDLQRDLPPDPRGLYGPLTRGVLAAAERMKVIQAGSLHAYLAYVIALVVGLVLLLWWRG